MAKRSFKVTNTESQRVQIVPINEDCPSTALPNNLDVTGLAGHFNQIKEYSTNEPFWRENGNINGIRVLIEKMERSSELVGGPIDILSITKSGACWAKHQKDCNADIPECGDMKPESKSEKPTQRSPLPDNSPPIAMIVVVFIVSVVFLYLFVRRG